MKYLLPVGLLLIIFLIWLQPVNVGTIEITIPHGTNAKDIAEFLSECRVIRDVHEFLFWLRIMGKEKNLHSGTYELQKYKNPVYVIMQLTHGGISDITVTIPEGLTVYETADILYAHGVGDRQKFVAICFDSNFVKHVGLYGTSLEGYLFPDTYSFSESQTDTAIVMTFIRNFTHQTKNYEIVDPESLYRILILASLVEKEAKYEDERSIISKVFINRLTRNKPLESCATVLYALKNTDYEKYQNKTKLLNRDLNLDSPYNTYVHTGLPPGPICSPGTSSIRAAIVPADVEFLYFVSMGNGKHHFSKTYREHIAAKAKYNEKN
jgi:UPF0755 protein